MLVELTSCPSGSLSGGTVSPSCPVGAVLGGLLTLARAGVDTSLGNDSDMGPASTCDVRITVLEQTNIVYGSGFFMTSICSSVSGCPLLSLSNDTIMESVTEEKCKIEAGTNYQVTGPNGNLTLRAGKEIRLGDGFSVGIDGTLTLEIDPSLLP